MSNPYGGSHVLLIDGAHMMRRSMHQPNLRNLSSSTGVPSGGIFGFLNSLKSSINSLQASTVIVCWEGGHSKRRKEVYPEYKVRDYSNKDVEKDEHGFTDYEYYRHQTEWVEKILEVLAIPQLRTMGKEGDDVIYQVTRLLRGQKTIVSEDADFFTLINEDVSVFRPIKKVLVNLDNFKETTSLATPKHFLYSKAMLGDPSDGIPGIAKGVGGKTINDIVQKIEDPNDLSIQRIIQEAATFNKSRYNKVVEAGEAPIRRNLELIDISHEVFNVVEMTQLANELEQKKYPNIELANKILNTLEFNPASINFLVSRLSRMTEFTLASIIDKDFILRTMMNQTTVVNG